MRTQAGAARYGVAVGKPYTPGVVRNDLDGTGERGETSDRIAAYKKKLIALGLLDPKHDEGYFGGRAQEAVRKFQAAHGLEPTGELDPRTAAAIDKATAGKDSDGDGDSGGDTDKDGDGGSGGSSSGGSSSGGSSGGGVTNDGGGRGSAGPREGGSGTGKTPLKDAPAGGPRTPLTPEQRRIKQALLGLSPEERRRVLRRLRRILKMRKRDRGAGPGTGTGVATNDGPRGQNGTVEGGNGPRATMP